MIILGIILLIIGLITGVGALQTIGVILALVGLVLAFVPSLGGGRRYY